MPLVTLVLYLCDTAKYKWTHRFTVKEHKKDLRSKRYTSIQSIKLQPPGYCIKLRCHVADWSSSLYSDNPVIDLAEEPGLDKSSGGENDGGGNRK